ncbi:hypothetical protein MEQU1_001098 [Malassezia equina]|uniref:H/ACA ribonucleoprotein complex non-core subunit NAF1 n=1 Tax=Malassezia equina TaxID=1381935 RepID=A0AAF0EDH8_9BASI|nr:hypothetical protein MEQU1_001098 [Malassezia equina]
MGADQSKLRSWTRATATDKEADTFTPASQVRENTQPMAEEAPVSVEVSRVDHQVEDGDDSMASSAPAPPDAGEEPGGLSLSQHRKLVQELRSKQGPTGSSDAHILAEMKRAGVSDTRMENDADDVEQDSSDSDSDESTSSDSSSDTNVPLHAQPDDDDEGPDSSMPPRTKNEFGDDYIMEPAIQKIKEEDLPSLERIGWVHSIVGNVVLVEQDSSVAADDTTRSYDVLDSESLLCFEDGSVLGLVFETFGSVKQPMYSIRFRSPEAIDRSIVQEKKPVYFLPANSTYVLTRLIRTKGSDASNVWDEEVADDEIEYSDDEAEAAAKKKNKKGKHARPDSVHSEDVDPSTASLGPLGGSGPSTSRSGRKRASQGSGWSEGPKRSRQGASTSTAANMPHYNPRFAEQWFRPTTPGTLYPPTMPAFPVPGYSPNYPSLHDYAGSTYPTYMTPPSAPGYFPPRRSD